MEYELLGWPPDGPKLRLDYERFSYAGKFVMTTTGKAVARDAAADVDESAITAEIDGTAVETPIVAAVAFNEDRTDDAVLWLRYVTVERTRRGEGIGPKLLALVRDRAKECGYERLRIAVNNPFAYEALYRTGFGYTGETTGIAELILEHPAPAVDDSDDDDQPTQSGPGVSQERYQEGLEEFRDRDLSADEKAFLESRRESDPPNPNSNQE